jgi:integrase
VNSPNQKKHGKPGRKRKTIASAFQEAKTFWTWLREEDVITKAQWESVWESKVLTRFLRQFDDDTEEQVQFAVDDAFGLLEYLVPRAAQDLHGLEMITLLALTTGMRIGEILKLQPKQLDNRCRAIQVKKAKTKAGNRPVEVPSFMVGLLEQLKADTEPKAPLFPYSYDQMYPRVRKLYEQFGLEKAGFHALRRTNSTLRVLGGQSPDAIIQAFGHTNFDMTQGHYIAPGAVENTALKRVYELLEKSVKLNRSVSVTPEN